MQPAPQRKTDGEYGELYGHEEAKRTLRGLRAHTLLFTGPERVGRRGLARWYAALLNCLSFVKAAGTPTEPCGRCPSCLAFGEGHHPDYREVAPEATTKTGRVSRRPEIHIDQLVPRPGGEEEPLSRWLELRPRFKKRVGVIDQAEKLGESAANAFLKLLEEPPSYAVVILIAPSPGAVLPTIASRSTPVRLGAVDPSQVPVTLPTAHPAARLGRAGDLLAAAEQPDTFKTSLDCVDAYVSALSKGLENAFEAADALEKLWSSSTDLDVADLLRARLSESAPHHYARALGSVTRCEEALEAYASPGIALSVLTLELRAAFRE